MAAPPTHTSSQEPHPATAEGVITSIIGGITLAILNWWMTTFFTAMADIQDILGNTGHSAFNLSFIVLAWILAYIFIGHIAPILGAYFWAGFPGIAVYSIGWLGTTLILSQSFTIGMILLIASIFLVVILDAIRNSGRRRNPPRTVR